MPKTLLCLLAAAIAVPSAFAQTDKPLTETDLLKQIESLSPAKSATAAQAAPASSGPLLGGDVPLGDKKPFDGRSAEGKAADAKNADKPGEKKAKGPTEITALEATFDQKANLAVFIGGVIVKDPEFNVTCDKLTAHLKHQDKAADANATPAPTGKGPKGATPKPATPATTPKAADGKGSAAPSKGGGLEKAIAITTSDRRVVITQDKVEADGTISHSIGLANKAVYDAITGDITLTGMPDVTQKVNRCVATDPVTIMILNRDGHMHAIGPHKTIIVDKGDLDGSSSSK